MDNKTLAKEIIAKVGGKSNIVQAWHCITRLRFNLSDGAKVDIEGIKNLNGVLTAQFQGEQFQVVIGNNVANVYEAMKDELGELSAVQTETKQKVNPINVVFDTISGIFTPILPAIIGAGLLKGLLTLFMAMGWLAPDSSEYFVFNMISDGAFYFLPFLLAFSAAKKLKTNEYVAVSLAAIMMYPTFAGLESGTTLKFFFMNIPVANYSSSVIPIILGVLLLRFVFRFIDKYVPKMLRLIFTPLLSLLITAPLVLFLIAPLGNYIGVYVAAFFVMLFDKMGPLAGLLLGGLMPFIVMTGMHYSLFPIAFDSLGRLGYDFILLPMNFVNNMAQCGATLAVAIKTKDEELRSMAFSCAISASFGITEPAMYGVTLKLKRPMYAAMVGSGVGGALFGFFGVKAFAFSIPGITSFPGYISPDFPQNIFYACLGVVVSFLIAFILTMVTFNEKTTEGLDIGQSVNDVPSQNIRSTDIYAPVSGEAVPLSEVGDDIFAKEVLGKGVGILPTTNVVVAPFDGIVSMVADSKHALGVTSTEGTELLIHIGINTVSLNGKGFAVSVQTGQTVAKGEALLTFDAEWIKENNLSTAIAVIVTNTDDFSSILTYTGNNVVSGQNIIMQANKNEER